MYELWVKKRRAQEYVRASQHPDYTTAYECMKQAERMAVKHGIYGLEYDVRKAVR